MTKSLLFRLTAVALIAAPLGVARADLVFQEALTISGQGFGNVTNLVTLQSNQNTEQGCFSLGGAAAFVPGGGVTSDFCNESGANDVAPPAGPPKDDVVLLSSVGITSASEIAVLFNADQSGGGGITLNDLVVTFYAPNGSILYNAILPNNWCTSATFCSGLNSFGFTEQGVGGAGFVFTLSSAQQTALLAAATGAGLTIGQLRIGGSGAFGCSGSASGDCLVNSGGPETVSVAKGPGTPTVVPEPTTTALVATGLAGLAGFVRRRRRSS